MRSFPRLALWLAASLLATGAALAVGSAIAEDRASIEARFAAERQACQQHFAVNHCVDAARRKEQEALAPVMAQERAQAAEDRRRRSEAQVERRRARDRAEAGEGGSQLTTDMLLALGALFCTVAGYYAVLPMMEAARAGQASVSFATLHIVSTGFFTLKGLLVLALAWRLTRPPASS